MKKSCMIEGCSLPVHSHVHELCRTHDAERIENLTRLAREADKGRLSSSGRAAGS